METALRIKKKTRFELPWTMWTLRMGASGQLNLIEKTQFMPVLRINKLISRKLWRIR